MNSAVLCCATEIGRLTTIRPPRPPGRRKTTRNLSTRSPKTLLGTVGPVVVRSAAELAAPEPHPIPYEICRYYRYLHRCLNTYAPGEDGAVLKRGRPRRPCAGCSAGAPSSEYSRTATIVFHPMPASLPPTFRPPAANTSVQLHPYPVARTYPRYLLLHTGARPPTLRLAHVRARSVCVHKVT